LLMGRGNLFMLAQDVVELGLWKDLRYRVEKVMVCRSSSS
jgi:hypothetical protein